MGKILYGNTVFKSSDDYTDAEVLTDKIYFGKKVYRKCFKYTLNATIGRQFITHNIKNIDRFVSIQGVWSFNDADFWHMPFVYVNASAQVALGSTRTQILVHPGDNRSGTLAEIVLEYTCTDR